MSSAEVHVKLAEYDHELARITDQDREYANDLLGDLQERPCRQEPVETVAEWFRKVRYEAVMADRKRIVRRRRGRGATMRFWFDTEFYEDGRTIELISIGAVAEDGRTYYAEAPGADMIAAKSGWLEEHVLPHLRGPQKYREYIASDLIEFMGEKPEIWAYYADYDWVALCQLHGRMIDLPKGWPMFCRDVKQLALDKGNPKLPKQTSAEHDALADALWTRDVWNWLMAK